MEVSISAVIITLNEERNIRRCLESLEGIADEIVVVDSYSTDDTEKICKEFNARFIKHRFFGYIEQKNWAVLQAYSPYILSLDADESLSAELRGSILEVKHNWTHDGYYFNRLSSYAGKWIRHTSMYPDRKLRLWDSRKGRWGGVNPHDKYMLEKGSSRKFLKGDLHHISYRSVKEHVAQMNSFSTIRADAYFEQGKRFRTRFIIINPLWRFIKDYILRGGFRDGYMGLTISINSSFEVFLKYIKLRNLYSFQRQEQKKSICFMNSEKDWGGGEKWHYDVAAHLSERGYQVFYISSPSSPLVKRMNELGIPGYEIRLSNLSFLNPYKLIKLVILFRREKVRTLIINLPSDMKVGSIAANKAGVPNIIYRRGSGIPIRNNTLNRYLLRKLVTGIIANSLEVKRTILANNKKLVPEEKISIIYNGVYPDTYLPNNSMPFSGSGKEIILGSAGRFSEEKGHFHLLDLMKVLSDSNYRFRLLLAGEGKLQDALQMRARELGLEDRINFVGFVSDMPAFLQSLDIFLLPSRYEGFSNVVLEAMASSKPVISFDVGSTREIIEHRVTGFVGKENTVEEMAGWVLELAKDESLRREIGQKARARVVSDFSFERGLEEITKLIAP